MIISYFIIFLAGVSAMQAEDTPHELPCHEYLQQVSKRLECDQKEPFTRGSFGAVFKVQRKTDKTPFAMKVIRRPGKKHPTRFAFITNAEIRAIEACDHPNVIKLVNYKRLPSKRAPDLVILIMEYAEDGNLSDYVSDMQEKGSNLSVKHALKILLQISEGLDHIHSKGFVHRDIKLKNIGIDGGMFKILDFGLACEKNEGFAKVSGTPTHVDPFPFTFAGEKRKEFPWTSASDVYSLGVVLHELILGEPLYQGKDLRSQLTHLRAKVSTKYRFPEGMDETVAYLINRMTLLDPKARITLPEVMKEIETYLESEVHFQIKETTLDNLTPFERSKAGRLPHRRLLSLLRTASGSQASVDRTDASWIIGSSSLLI